MAFSLQECTSLEVCIRCIDACGLLESIAAVALEQGNSLRQLEGESQLLDGGFGAFYDLQIDGNIRML